MKRIIVIGSSNTDMVVKCKKLPSPGETILGGAFLMNPGGKGANQAVAAARLKGNVTFVAKTGNDLFGEQSKLLFEKEGIDTRFLIRDQKNPSGVALIAVDENGENCIVVASGSNATLSAYDIDEEVYVTDREDVYLMQLEIPVGTVDYVAQKVFSKENRVILNPAPARQLSQELLDSVYVLTPNEIEAEILTGIKVENASSAERSAMKLLDKGVKNVVITMGAAGAYLCTPEMSKMIPVVPVKAVDTTAAGDVFNGALAVALAEGKDLEEAVGFANRAASISVTRLGAQASAPYRNELD
ncbi:MAG: ribokinase [Bacteroidales bacterium]|jgi:ribokinase|nr:ribokinase [Bacteroidales bacterium]